MFLCTTYLAVSYVMSALSMIASILSQLAILYTCTCVDMFNLPVAANIHVHSLAGKFSHWIYAYSYTHVHIFVLYIYKLPYQRKIILTYISLIESAKTTYNNYIAM